MPDVPLPGDGKRDSTDLLWVGLILLELAIGVAALAVCGGLLK